MRLTLPPKKLDPESPIESPWMLQTPISFIICGRPASFKHTVKWGSASGVAQAIDGLPEALEQGGPRLCWTVEFL